MVLILSFIYLQVFFFKAQISKGTVERSANDIEDYLWVSKDELAQYVPPTYHQCVNKFVMEL